MSGSNDVVLRWFDGAAEAARGARRDPSDVEALHRFRINVRRLVDYVRILEKPCGVSPKLRKRLRRALRETGPWRDGHVQALWLKDYRERTRQKGDGVSTLAEILSKTRAPAPKPRWWRKADRTLRKTRRAVEALAMNERALRAAQLEAADKGWRKLAKRLRRLERTGDPAALHAARISVKRLRYLLEAMGRIPRGLPAPSALHGLQAAFGGAHDRDVIAAGITSSKRAAGLRAPRRRALDQLKREKRARLSRARRYWRPLLARRRANS